MAPTQVEHGAKPGDLIEIFRKGGTYQHWAVYIGEDEVVHLTDPGGDSSSSGSMGLSLGGIAQVMRHNIWEVIHGDPFKINNLLDNKYKPRDRDVIVKEACGMVGTERQYNVVSLNCEHFATMLRYGQPESRQVGGAYDYSAYVTHYSINFSLFVEPIFTN
ncbi:Retinoic acid receptor responder protein 3 [Liparis tanakae]|uniref:Retinoic acid receptor responder protein 3 n=1 Tax=Liparis tanakae TaxID=230148 RepID=A0A4Z2EJF1_9TELE|nr:Retinoic acid receptor responder protein 3 [Liparis tanakae]